MKIIVALLIVMFSATAFAGSQGYQVKAPVVPLHKEVAPVGSVFITYVQATARSMDAACYEMSKKAQKLGAEAVYSVQTNGSSVGSRSTYICWGDVVTLK